MLLFFVLLVLMVETNSCKLWHRFNPCQCGEILEPVCCNGVNYENTFKARCAGCRGKRQPGKCHISPPLPCNCPAVEDPVCCFKGPLGATPKQKQYSNRCRAGCAKENLRKCIKGPCRPIVIDPPFGIGPPFPGPVICTADAPGVCCREKYTYTNMCVATQRNGERKEDCKPGPCKIMYTNESPV